MKINEIIQEKRKTLKMTQREFAERLNVSDKTVSRWENGTTYPDIDMIPRIARELGIGIEELFGGVPAETVKREEKYDYGKILNLRIFFFVFIFVFLVVQILIISASMTEKEQTKMTLLTISWVLEISSIFAYFIGLLIYRNFYKGKFYQEEYELCGSRLTNFVVIFTLIGLAWNYSWSAMRTEFPSSQRMDNFTLSSMPTLVLVGATVLFTFLIRKFAFKCKLMINIKNILASMIGLVSLMILVINYFLLDNFLGHLSPFSLTLLFIPILVCFLIVEYSISYNPKAV